MVTVLVVDDDANFRLLARRALEQANLTVIEAYSGQEMLDRFAANTVDVILLDIMMPEMDGYEACRRLRSLPDGGLVPVLMLTGLDDIESIKNAYEAGATDFISKPVNWLILGHRVLFLQRANRQIRETVQQELNNLAALYDLPELAIPDEDDAEWQEEHTEMLRAIYTLQNIVGGELFNQYFTDFLGDIQVLLKQLKEAANLEDELEIKDKIITLKVKFGTLSARTLNNDCEEILSLNIAENVEKMRTIVNKIITRFDQVDEIIRERFGL
ncbi:MAG: response regulator [Candidatus Hinthialibacter antarcticus]|nr:response regulator [Candidatus Hinthialibacter antarcticus]